MKEKILQKLESHETLAIKFMYGEGKRDAERDTSSNFHTKDIKKKNNHTRPCAHKQTLLMCTLTN